MKDSSLHSDNGDRASNGDGLSPGLPDGALDWALLAALFRRRQAFYVTLATVLFATLLVALLFLFPRRYSTVSSIALQQNNATALGSSLASLANISLGAGKDYDGVLHSRRFAIAAAKSARIRDLYHLDLDEDAIEMVQGSLMTEDPKNGLTYLHVTLPGPSVLAPGAKAQEERVKDAAKVVNDSLVASLKNYLATTNTDHDTVLLHQGREQLDAARRDYDTAVGALTRFIRTTNTRGAEMASASPLVAAEGAAAAAEGGGAPSLPLKASSSTTDLAVAKLAELYRARGELEVNIQSAEETLRGQSKLAAESVSGARALPAEDPLLTDARSQVRQAERTLDELRVTLADSNPQVVAARENVEVARRRLHQEQQAIASNQTSAAVDIAALRTRYDAVNRQIDEAEQDFKVSRDYSTDLLRLKNEIDLRLEVLKAAATQYAIINVSSVAGDSQMDVVDQAILPDRGRPGAFLLAAMSAFLAVTVVAILILRTYRSERVRSVVSRATMLPSASGTTTVSPIAAGSPRE